MRRRKDPPPYSIEHGFAVMDEKQSGLSQGLAALAPYSRASKAESPIERNIRVDSAIYMADIHEGGKYRFGDGTATAPAIAFAGSPKTGIYRSAANVIAATINGVQQLTLNATHLSAVNDIQWKSGTAFNGIMEHANSADRHYTFQNADGTVAFLTDIVSPSSALLDGVIHTDTVAQAVTKGSLVYGNATPKWDELVIGSPGDVLTVVAGVPAWTAPSGGSTHDILSATHTDSSPSAVSRGSLIVGNSTPAWAELNIGGAGTILKSDGTDATWGAPTTQTSTLLDGSVHTDTVVQGATKGSIVVGNSTPKWDELVVGTDAFVLMADSAQTLGVKWAAIPLQTSTLLDGTVHTDTVAQAPTRGSIIVANSTPKWDELVINALINPKAVLVSDGSDAIWRRNQGSAVYVPTTADTAINSVTDITIATKDVTEVSAGDQIVIEGDFTILNNSGATRVYVITIDFDAAFDIEFSTGALATSATLIHPFTFRAVCDIRSTSLAYCVNTIYGQLAAGIASGGDTTMLATSLHAHGWGTSGADLTTTTTCVLKIRSANATATQTCRLHHFSIRKFTPF